MPRKSIPASTSLDAATNEELDQIANWQGVSHAESLRRAVHHLYASCKAAQPQAPARIDYDPYWIGKQWVDSRYGS